MISTWNWQTPSGRSVLLVIGMALTFACQITLQGEWVKPSGPEFEKFSPLPPPPLPSQSLLRSGDRIAICGDSITEQRMYSKIVETYLTVAVPELGITCRQYGWSGERAPGFLARMKNDALRFNPTLATTCYGMNDHEYRPYEERIGKTYREAQTAIVTMFRESGCRVVLGSAGTVGKMPSWVKSATGTVEDLNLNLCRLRNINIEIARELQIGFADIFWPMLVAGVEAPRKFGPEYHISGSDGVHPGWGGQTFMAYSFLRALGVSGEIGTLTLDPSNRSATASEGHEVMEVKEGELRIRSRRYPFCTEDGDPSKDDQIRSAFALIPFEQELNRFRLVINNPPVNGLKITWGTNSMNFSAESLRGGINLASEFRSNPFSLAFKGVWEAVGAKQAYETRQIKELFHGQEGAADMEATVALTEKARARHVAKLHVAFQPVEHVIRWEPLVKP